MVRDLHAAAEFGCHYTPTYSGRCDAIAGESGFCKRHEGKTCTVCEAQATHECNHTGQFVCGAPLCDGCEGYVDSSKPGGSWGFLNHWHREIMRAQPPRTMLGDDLGLAAG